jgi:hypothetical protein
VFNVQYEHEFPYSSEAPRLTLQIYAPNSEDKSIETDFYLDSGAEISLFNGELTHVIGVELLSGKRQEYSSTAGQRLEARLHDVVLKHPEMGIFELKVGFATQPIRRNLLGRDFFDKVQIGFREHQLTFYITATP